MTPEEIAKLARKCASAVAKVEGPSSYYERMLPILTVHLAAREEECARLREAADNAVAAYEHHQLTCREHRSPYIKENGRRGASPYAELVESCQDLRAVLSPQQEQGNVQLPDMP